MKRFALIFAMAAACGGSSSNPDAPASIDAKVSSVKSVACTGSEAVTVTVVGSTQFAFSPMNPSITAGQAIHFNTTSFHPVKSGTPSAPTNDFEVANGDGCLMFTQAGSFPFFCEVHLFPGTVTVN
ncbi:MAG TPA: hypothetical protein VL463_21860 [Kofleriaceae bacterium]|jgi:plastocyanin|nr:hypothetical protein [Kofleriaceae bacterium]